jgi:nifR3 family TIM-barrel protein
MAEAPAPASPLRIGRLHLEVPVVLAPMAGVTDAPFRVLCRRFGAGLYVNQMVTARAYVERNPRTLKLAEFAPDEQPRSIQLYGTEERSLGEAVRRLTGEAGVDHVDLNFGCPVPKVTRVGGGAALPVKRTLLRRLVAAAVRAAGDVPVTAKFRMGVDEHHPTYLDTGLIAAEEGCAAIALHARTAEQLYAPHARWDAIAELKAHVPSIPVLGNGDVFEAADAVRMMGRTGCDGVVVGRGCLGRPWLFADLAAALAGRPVAPPPKLGEVVATMSEHADLIVDWYGDEAEVRQFRKHGQWYLTGYPVGGEARRRIGLVGSRAELRAVLEGLDPDLTMLPGAMRTPRSHRNGPRRVALPAGWLDSTGDAELAAAAEDPASGG